MILTVDIRLYLHALLYHRYPESLICVYWSGIDEIELLNKDIIKLNEMHPIAVKV